MFILSRIRELWLGGAPAKDAITVGIGRSAGVVTSPAVIMVAVFSIFAALSLIEFKVFGVAMAAAVLIDATVVRGVLLPAGRALLGERAFGSPRARRDYGATASVTCSEPPGATNGWSPGRARRAVHVVRAQQRVADVGAVRGPGPNARR